MSNQQDKDQQINQLLKSHYNNIELGDNKLEALLAMAESSSSVGSRPETGDVSVQLKRSWFWQRNFAIAATVLIVTLSVLQFTSFTVRLYYVIIGVLCINHSEGA